MTRRQIITATAIIGYYTVSVLGHLEVSLWLMQRRESELLGSYKLADFLPHAGTLLLTAVVIWQARRAWRGCNHGATLAAWAAWLVAVIAADRLLIYSFPEYLHYPQYALLAFLIARFHDPERTAFAIGPVLLAVTVLGIADEALQYTWITISYSNYLDFNDFLLNLLGGVAGLLLYYGFKSGNQYEPDPDVGRLSPKGASRYAQPRQSGRHSILDPESTKKASAAAGHKTTESRIKPGLAKTRSSARYGLLGFAWLGTGMLLAASAAKVTSTEPGRLQPIEREPSYNIWIPGPRAGRYYVLDPITGTLMLVTLGMLASATPIVPAPNRLNCMLPSAPRHSGPRRHSRARGNGCPNGQHPCAHRTLCTWPAPPKPGCQ